VDSGAPEELAVPKGQSRMDNPEKLVTLGTQDEDKKKQQQNNKKKKKKKTTTQKS
jgi:hypothetical protein